MKINVSRSATAGTYTITITGKGADGKTHETTFTLTITPVPVEIPVSGVNTIAPYWQVATPFTITATASDNDGHVTDVALYYRYSANNSSWGSWTSFGTDNDNSDGWSWSFTAPENDGYYEFFSIARDNDSNQESTKLLAEARCGVDRTVPSAPQLVSPTNGVRIDTATPTFDWADVSDFAGVTYEFVVDDDSDFSSPVLSKVGLTTSTYQLTIQENLADKKYYWRVRAVDKAGNIGVWADAWSVVIRGTPPPAVSIGAILVGENAVADFTQHNIDVMTVRIVAENNLLDVKVTIDILAAPPAEVPAPIMSVYAFFDISTNVEAGGIREATVEFKISKSWIEQNGIDEGTIKLLRYHNGEWQELSTRLVSSDSEYLYFEATTPGFSLFVATGEKISPSPPPPVAPSGLPLLPLVVLSTIAVGMGGFIAHRLLTRRSKYFTMLRRLKQAVVGPRARRVGEPLVEPPVRVRKQVSQAELAELKRLERIARERKRKFAR